MLMSDFEYPGKSVRSISVFKNNGPEPVCDTVAEEVPVALVYNGISQAVLMATPNDFEDLAAGFSVSEGIVGSLTDIYDITVASTCSGVQIDLQISSERFWQLKCRRRSMAARTGCGLCGLEQLGQVHLNPAPVAQGARFNLDRYGQALAYLAQAEQIGAMTGCTHAAVGVDEEGTLLACAEDVGRHVALDKLLGKCLRSDLACAALFVSSRASFEMVQKAAMCGVQILFAVSAPTAPAVDIARSCGMTLAGFCRPGAFNVYTGRQRLYGEDAQYCPKKRSTVTVSSAESVFS